MGRHERFHSELAAGFEAEKKKANLDWRRALECLDRRRDVSLVKYDRRHRELHRAIKELKESVFSRRFSGKSPRQRACSGSAKILLECFFSSPRAERPDPSAFLLKYVHHAAPAQLFHYFMHPLEWPTIPVTDLPTLSRPRIPSSIA